MNHPEVETTHVGQQLGYSAHTHLKMLVTSALSLRRKVFLMGFELRFPLNMAPPNDDGTLARFLASLDLKCGPGGLDLDPSHAWLRVQDGAHPKYRCALLLDGDRLGSVYGAQVIVQEMWNLALGLPRDPNYGLAGHGFVGSDGIRREGGVMLWRDDYLFEDKLKDCLDWMS